ncbi:MAG: hypothetical protein CM15mV41_0090 [Caudoviricetes sp.]|nr:MAG: hypothetical protein CM15mV41_0090 [Caudoviricetes sp.]
MILGFFSFSLNDNIINRHSWNGFLISAILQKTLTPPSEKRLRLKFLPFFIFVFEPQGGRARKGTRLRLPALGKNLESFFLFIEGV